MLGLGSVVFLSKFSEFHTQVKSSHSIGKPFVGQRKPAGPRACGFAWSAALFGDLTAFKKLEICLPCLVA